MTNVSLTLYLFKQNLNSSNNTLNISTQGLSRGAVPWLYRGSLGQLHSVECSVLTMHQDSVLQWADFLREGNVDTEHQVLYFRAVGDDEIEPSRK